MCGIIGMVAEKDVAPILLEGLRRLEYRGYDSAGLAVLDNTGPDSAVRIQRVRAPGNIAHLTEVVNAHPIAGRIGIAHTRWATHGIPSESNAHPHIAQGRVAVVHNGIIENHRALREKQIALGCRFTSETDTEVIAHQIDYYLGQGRDLPEAVSAAIDDLDGTYALGVISTVMPTCLVAARRGSPLVVGFGTGEHFIASDVAALIPVTRRFIALEDGDVAVLRREGVRISDATGAEVQRAPFVSELTMEAVGRGKYRHYMEKEIHEQPHAIAETLEGRLHNGRVLETAFGPGATGIFDRVRAVQIIACGTSYHAALVARNWFEGLAGIACRVEIASEFRYRHPVVTPDTLVVAISQSGETADTLAALRAAKTLGFGPSLAIVNVPESSLAREADLMFMTRAGPEIGVASTKAFTTQLVALLLLCLALGRRYRLGGEREEDVVRQLQSLPRRCEAVLALNFPLQVLSHRFVDKDHALFLGRGVQYPVAMEGALKLKEISYIHAEAYPAGELKHGPLALVDARMPVIAIAPNDDLLEKLKSNLEEVRARGGELYVFAPEAANVAPTPMVHVIDIPFVGENVSPIVYVIPLQLLAYHVAVIRGTDVDRPRNLAKSVTVE
uniref:Glutamine--fructose-6-phosphate aminotransferase [isomerizing] n=1 Tax=Candidatus Kentrum sp. FM TaxID=2126340 RepID=A0A450SMM9_9GAMM|nr:MAG: glucosamine--fructose-6-phosphate aminotransferase (isomerizing) [Candidatus Kentron sp. FM]VFJ72183.1 MAG: glucosamine--fructose-6-phosphate aminotransferase (isomerizing) [Candidatus Kentron sp. FM]VFK19481.1 MAG: glucosamine--fructose-6-phosphate aminotransferase (isomerizing) [Candidatus Kentron sp. FM]